MAAGFSAGPDAPAAPLEGGIAVYRIASVFVIAAAIGLHFGYCEWYYGEDAGGVTSEQLARAIYYRHRSSPFHKRGDYLPRDLMLLAKPSVRTEDAKLYGVLVPVLMAGGAGLALYFGRNPGGAENA
jgi:hypothetical protein